MNDEQKLLHTAGLLVLKDNKLLLAYSNNKKAWYLPGGKLEADETALQALKREVLEELNLNLEEKLLKYYGHITAPAYGEDTNVTMEQDCFLYELRQNVTPGKEIGAVSFFDYDSYLLEPAQVPGVLQTFKKLKGDKLL